MNADHKTLNHLLIKAAHDGDDGKIEELLGRADPHFQRSEALWQAIEQRHTKCVAILAGVSEIEHRHVFAAVDTNDWAIFSPLLDYIAADARTNWLNQCLVRAARFGHTTILESLITVADPMHQNSLAFRWAVSGHHQRCIDLLYPISDVENVLAYFKEDIDRSNGSFNSIAVLYNTLKERFDADKLKKTLVDNIATGVADVVHVENTGARGRKI